MRSNSFATIGKITGAFGVRGWVRLESYTDPAVNLFKLPELKLFQRNTVLALHLDAYQSHQKSWVAKFSECNDRDLALAWRGAYIKIDRAQLPALPAGQYYWMDLEGLTVYNLTHDVLGKIDHLFATGANDVIVIKREDKEVYIPYVYPQIVKEVNLDQGYMVVDWVIPD